MGTVALLSETSIAAPWLHRFHSAVVVGQWVALTIGMISDLVVNGGAGASIAAMAIASIYTIGSTLVPEVRYRARFGVETITLFGVLLVLVVLTLTGGAESPYLLLSMGPPVLATIHGGFRTGLTTGFLGAAVLALITLAQGGELIDTGPAMSLYLVFVLLVGVIRKLLDDIHQQATRLAMENATTSQQLERLEQIHKALLRLSEDVSAGRLNAIEVAADTLDGILTRIPGAAGRLAVKADDGGMVVLAARGIPADEGHVYELPLSTRDAEVGGLELTAPRPLEADELAEVSAILHPVSVAFANLQLLDDIVGSAVSEERTRLARELHDEIGPALASLGLALDMAAMQQSDHPEVAEDLGVLRSNVTKLVEDVRAAVADLRSAPGPTLTARILQGTASLEGEPPIVVDIEERRSPRSSIIADLTSIITEAARNAHRHADAGRIVISGRVDRSFGHCAVVDDGIGFDPEHEPYGHFGLVGMRERASKLGATIKIDSKEGAGTAVTVEWGSR
jgi:signal transduction histidine kinase